MIVSFENPIQSIMKNLFLFFVLFAITFTSCDLDSSEVILVENERNVSLRFKNTSDIDFDAIQSLGLDINTLKSGESTEYFNFNRLVTDEDNNASFSVVVNIQDANFSNEIQDNPLTCGSGGCSMGYDNSYKNYIRDGSYSLILDVSSDYTNEGRNDDAYIITRLIKE